MIKSFIDRVLYLGYVLLTTFRHRKNCLFLADIIDISTIMSLVS